MISDGNRLRKEAGRLRAAANEAELDAERVDHERKVLRSAPTRVLAFHGPDVKQMRPRRDKT